jgi:hypothetical protein
LIRLAVLEIPSVVSAENTKRVQIATDSKKSKKCNKNSFFLLLTFIRLAVV